MTEEEKRRIALEFLKTEQNRTSVPASIFDNHTVIDRHLAQTKKSASVWPVLPSKASLLTT